MGFDILEVTEYCQLSFRARENEKQWLQKQEMFNLASKLAMWILDSNGIFLELLLYNFICFLLLFFVVKLLVFGQRDWNYR